MNTIESTVKYIRSKNAGPFWLTIDAFCANVGDTERVAVAAPREAWAALVAAFDTARGVATLAERFWPLVERGTPSACWPYTGREDLEGYGRFRVDGHDRLAHRVAYQLHHGGA